MFLCLVFPMLSRLFIAPLWSPAGKRLNFWLLLVMFIVFLLLSLEVFSVRCGILGQVWYLIVSNPDLCRLLYFVKQLRTAVFFVWARMTGQTWQTPRLI